MKNFISLFEDIHNKFMENFNKNNKLDKKNNITSTENYYLSIINSLKDITLSKFAELAKITKPAATQIINKYVDKGYVIKKISDDDKRVCYIELSEQIKKYLADSCNKLNKMYNECLSFLTEEEFEQFNNLLLKINDNL